MLLKFFLNQREGSGSGSDETALINSFGGLQHFLIINYFSNQKTMSDQNNGSFLKQNGILIN